MEDNSEDSDAVRAAQAAMRRSEPPREEALTMEQFAAACHGMAAALNEGAKSAAATPPGVALWATLPRVLDAAIAGKPHGLSLAHLGAENADKLGRQLSLVAQISRDVGTLRHTLAELQVRQTIQRSDMAYSAGIVLAHQRRLGWRLSLNALGWLVMAALVIYLGACGVLPQPWMIGLGMLLTLVMVLLIDLGATYDTLRAEVRDLRKQADKGGASC